MAYLYQYIPSDTTVPIMVPLIPWDMLAVCDGCGESVRSVGSCAPLRYHAGMVLFCVDCHTMFHADVDDGTTCTGLFVALPDLPAPLPE